MEIAKFRVIGNQIVPCNAILYPSGSVKSILAQFSFAPEEDWAGLKRVACFQSTGDTVGELIPESGQVPVPWEVLQKPGAMLFVGVRGTDAAGEIVKPTVWCHAGFIAKGTGEGKDGQPHISDNTFVEMAEMAVEVRQKAEMVETKASEVSSHAKIAADASIIATEKADLALEAQQAAQLCLSGVKTERIQAEAAAQGAGCQKCRRMCCICSPVSTACPGGAE